MRLPKRGEKGFTLIELLIVVAILGVLAAVVIPNVGRFIGRGQEESEEAEIANVQSAVLALMVDNNLPILPAPISNRTNNMAAFPDNTSSTTSDFDGDGVNDKVTDPSGYDYDAATDKVGYILFGHDVSGNATSGNGPNPLQTNVNYVATNQTAYWYTVDALGQVTQYLSP